MNRKNRGLVRGTRTIAIGVLILGLFVTMSRVMGGCAFFESEVNSLKGSITGNTYKATFYANDGSKSMVMRGTNIDMENNIIKERVYVDGSWGTTETMSSVITITIDGKQVASCGDTIIFQEEGLEPVVDYYIEEINSKADGITDMVFIAGRVNYYKNKFGKPMGVIIKSQDGTPICAYTGDSVYWEVCQDLPKTTKLMIDGKALYIHRANFQLVDTALLDTAE